MLYQDQYPQAEIVTTECFGDAQDFMVVGDTLAERPAPPSPLHRFSCDTNTWTDPRPLAAIQAAQWRKISALRDHRTLIGGWLAQGKWFHANAKSVSQQLGLARKADLVAQSGGDMAAGFAGDGPDGLLYWKTMDGSFVLMTASLAHQIFDAAERVQGQVFAVAERHKAAMLAAVDPERYDFAHGWPAMYSDSAEP